MAEEEATPGTEAPREDDGRSDPWTDLALTLPIFVAYHIGVAFLPIRNAADLVTSELQRLVDHSIGLYAGLTLGIGALFTLVLVLLGQGRAFQVHRFGIVVCEAVLYGTLLRWAGSYVVGSLPLGPGGGSETFTSVVMSLGAGFYEELTFRVALYGLGAWVLRLFLGEGVRGFAVSLVWALVSAALFSGWHYVGPMADTFELRSFVYRATCGLVLTAIYVLRGFAPAVWTHALYDVWVMAF